MSDALDLRYPIGKFTPPATITRDDRRSAMLTIEQMPSLLREAVRKLDAAQMDTPYREGVSTYFAN